MGTQVETILDKVKVYVKQFNSKAYPDDDVKVMITDEIVTLKRELPRVVGHEDLIVELTTMKVVYRLAFLLNKPDAKVLLDEFNDRKAQIAEQLQVRSDTVDKAGIRTQGRIPNYMRQDYEKYSTFKREP